jgi:hypothetical protein
LNFQIGGRFILSFRAEAPQKELRFTYEDRESQWSAIIQIEEARQAHKLAIVSARLEGPSWQEQGKASGKVSFAIAPTVVLTSEQLDELKLIYATCYDLAGLAFAFRIDPCTYLADDGGTTIYSCGDRDNAAFQQRAERELQLYYIMRSLTAKPEASNSPDHAERIGRFRIMNYGAVGLATHFHDQVSNRHILVWCYLPNEGRPAPIHACLERDADNQTGQIERTYLPVTMVMTPAELAQFKSRFIEIRESREGSGDTFFLVSF